MSFARLATVVFSALLVAGSCTWIFIHNVSAHTAAPAPQQHCLRAAKDLEAGEVLQPRDLMMNVEVIAAGQETQPDPEVEAVTATVVTLLLTLEDAQKAQSGGWAVRRHEHLPFVPTESEAKKVLFLALSA